MPSSLFPRFFWELLPVREKTLYESRSRGREVWREKLGEGEGERKRERKENEQ